MSTAMAGTRPLLVASLRHDARLIAPWVVGVSALSMSSVIAYNILFSDPTTQAEFIASVASNPAFNLIFGPARDLTTIDGFTAWRSLSLGGFFASLMAILVVVRNGRANEDSGQAELIASGVVGRSTRLGVAVAMAAIASLATGVLAATATILIGGGIAASTSLAATFAASGLMFAGVAAVTSQIGSDASAAASQAITVLGASLLVRGYVDTVDPDGWAVWLSPLGWTGRVAPGSENNWWPLAACLALTVLLVALAFALQSRRDFGQGLVALRPGPERGGAVASVWGLAVRINRGAMISWTFAFVVIGFVFGLLSTSMIDVLRTNPAVAQILAAGAATPEELAFQLLITLLSLVVIIAAVYGVGVANRVYAEELEYRVEPLLAGRLSRPRYLVSNALIALLGPAVAVMVAAVTIGWIAASANESVALGSVVAQGLVELPALWLLIGIGLATVGARPRLRLLAWLGIVVTFGLTILGPSFQLPDWALGISPLWHVPNMKAADPGFGGLTGAALIAISLVGFRRRDVL